MGLVKVEACTLCADNDGFRKAQIAVYYGVAGGRIAGEFTLQRPTHCPRMARWRVQP